MRVNDQDDWQIKPLGHLGRASGLGFTIKAVEQTHHTLDNCQVLPLTGTNEETLVRFTREHPTVEVMRWKARSDFV